MSGGPKLFPEDPFSLNRKVILNSDDFSCLSPKLTLVPGFIVFTDNKKTWSS